MINFLAPFLIPKVNFPISQISAITAISTHYNNLHWETINYNQAINLKHFDNILTKNKNLQFDLLKINRSPALIIIIDKLNYEFIVKEFVFNKSFILMIDAGPAIRSSFYDKFKNINLNYAINKDIFMII